MNVALATKAVLRHLTTLLALALICLGMTATGQTNDGPEILFLHLQLKNGFVSLIKSSARPGHLKPRPNQGIPDGLHFELTDGDGHALWKGVIENPRSRWVGYEDPPGSGKLKRKKVELGEPEFTIRVPGLSKARQIEFYTVEPSSSNGTRQRKSLGKVDLPRR